MPEGNVEPILGMIVPNMGVFKYAAHRRNEPGDASIRANTGRLRQWPDGMREGKGRGRGKGKAY